MIALAASPSLRHPLPVAFLLLGLAMPGALLAAPTGRVTYVTRSGAYLDRGTDQGLKAGTKITLRRRRQKAGTCEVREVSEGRALCQGTGLKVGDRFVIPRAARRAAPKKKPPLKAAPLPARARERIAAAKPIRVAFQGKTSLGRGSFRFPAAATVQHRSWGMVRADTGYHQESASLSVDGLPLGALDAHLHADLSVLGWSSRSSTARYLPDDPVVFHLRELAGDLKLGKLPLRISAGRFIPRSVPGVSRLDGLQATWVPGKGAFSAGVYGGALPDARRLTPTLQQWTTGLFLQHHLRQKTYALREELRFGYSSTLLDLGRLDAEARATVDLRQILHLSLRGRLALRSNAAPGPRFDFGSAWLSLTPGKHAGLEAGFRSLASGAGDPDALMLQRSPGLQRAELGAYWGPSPKIRLAIRGSYDRLIALTGRTRIAFGPDLLLRDLLGRRSHLLVGYREELGFLYGRFLFASHRLSLSRKTRLETRISVSQLGPPETGRFPVLEGGGAGYLTVDLGRHLSLRTGVEVRAGDHGAGYGAHFSATGRL